MISLDGGHEIAKLMCGCKLVERFAFARLGEKRTQSSVEI